MPKNINKSGAFSSGRDSNSGSNQNRLRDSHAINSPKKVQIGGIRHNPINGDRKLIYASIS